MSRAGILCAALVLAACSREVAVPVQEQRGDPQEAWARVLRDHLSLFVYIEEEAIVAPRAEEESDEDSETQALAEMLDKSVETISNLERGTYMTGLETLLRVAQCLDVPMASFFEDVDTPRGIGRARLDQELELRRLGESLAR